MRIESFQKSKDLFKVGQSEWLCKMQTLACEGRAAAPLPPLPLRGGEVRGGGEAQPSVPATGLVLFNDHMDSSQHPQPLRF